MRLEFHPPTFPSGQTWQTWQTPVSIVHHVLNCPQGGQGEARCFEGWQVYKW